MSTIQLKYSYKRVNQFIKKRQFLLDNICDNKIVIVYKNYLKSVKANSVDLDYFFITYDESYRHHTKLKTHD